MRSFWMALIIALNIIVYDGRTLLVTKETSIGTPYEKNIHGEICLNITRIVRIRELLPVWFDAPNFARIFRNCTIWWEFPRRCYVIDSHFHPFVLVLKQLSSDYISQKSCKIKFWYKDPDKFWINIPINKVSPNDRKD